MANPSISLSKDTGDPSDFTLYTSEITEIVSQPTGQKHESNTNNSASNIPIDNGNASKSDNNRYSQASTSTSNYHRTSTISQRNRRSAQEHLNLHQNLILQESDILMQHGLQIPGNIPMLPLNIWNPNIMGLVGVNDVMMNPSILPTMPNFNQPMPMLQPELLMPEPIFAGKNHQAEQMLPVNKVPEQTYPKPITPICKPIDCNSCMVYPPSKGSSLPLVQKKPPGCRTIFVGGIPRNTTRMIIGDIFKRFGSITDIRLNNKFCHVRFEKGVSVDAALSLSGCRVSIGHSRHEDDSGLIFVDYSKAKDDMRDWEMTQQKNVQPVAPVIRKERVPSPPPPPAVVHCSDKELVKAHKNMKQNDTFLEVVQLLNIWLDDGECDKKNVDRIFAILQNANGHVRRLNDEKVELIKNLMVARDQCKEKVRIISSQVGHIEGLFVTASQQKVWDHLSKTQRKSLDDWKGELKKHKKAGPHNQSVLTKENDDMDLSDDNKDAVDQNRNAMAALAKENIRLQHQLEAAKKAAETYKMEQIKEEKQKNELLEKIETSMKLFQEESLKSEAKIKELKTALVAIQKQKEEFSKHENSQISKLKTENIELRQLLASGEIKYSHVREELTNIQMGLSKAKEQMANQDMFKERETILIVIIFSFLAPHPSGVPDDDIVKHARSLITDVEEGEIQSILKKYPNVFRLESGKGWTLNINIPNAENASTDATSFFNQITKETSENAQNELSETSNLEATVHTASMYKEMRRLKYIYLHCRNKSTGFERRIQELRRPTDPLDKIARKRIHTSPTNIFHITIPKITEERWQWLKENVAIPEKFEEELELEKQGLLPNFSDEEEEQERSNDSSDIGAPLQIPLPAENPDISTQNDINVPLLADETHELEITESTNDSPNICASLQNELSTDKPEISSQHLVGSNESQNDVNVPPRTDEIPELEIIEATVRTADSTVSPTYTKIMNKFSLLSNRELRRLKFLIYHCRENNKIFSPGLERRIQEFRGPTEPLKRKARRRKRINKTEVCRFSIPETTEERLKWLRENVSIPEKFDEEIELEEQGLLPNFSEEEESTNDSSNVRASTAKHPEISSQDSAGSKTQSQNNINDPLSTNETPEDAVQTANKTVAPADSEILASMFKEMRRLKFLLHLNSKKKINSPGFERRIQEFRRPTDPLDKIVRKRIFISPTKKFSITIPKITEERLKWLKENFPIPEKFEEEIELEKQGLLPNFSDEEESTNDSSNVIASLRNQFPTDDIEISSQNSVCSNQTQNEINVPLSTDEESSELKSYEAAVHTANKTILSADPKVLNEPSASMYKQMRRFKFILCHCRSNRRTFSLGFARRIQEFRKPTDPFDKRLRRRIHISPTETFRFTLPHITEERLKWLRENVPIPDKFEEEIELEEQGLLPSFSDEEEESTNDPEENVPSKKDETPACTKNPGGDSEIQESTIEKFLKTPGGLTRLSKVLAIFNSPSRWSPELRKILETLRPSSCFGPSATTLIFPDGTRREIGLPSVTPEALKEINKVVVPEKLPEEFIIEELSAASRTPVKVEQGSFVSGNKREAMVGEDESGIPCKRKPNRHAGNLHQNKRIGAASSSLLAIIKTEPEEIIVIEDDDDTEIDRKKGSVTDFASESDGDVTKSSTERKRIKIEPTTDYSEVMDCSVHIKNEPVDNKYGSQIPEQKSNTQTFR